MGKLIANLGCQHTCPMSDGTKSHVGGPILQGSQNVFAGSKSIARQGDQLQCSSPMLDMVQVASISVFVNGKGVARQGDITAHGGQIVEGFPTVLVG